MNKYIGVLCNINIWIRNEEKNYYFSWYAKMLWALGYCICKCFTTNINKCTFQRERNHFFKCFWFILPIYIIQWRWSFLSLYILWWNQAFPCRNNVFIVRYGKFEWYKALVDGSEHCCQTLYIKRWQASSERIKKKFFLLFFLKQQCELTAKDYCIWTTWM